MLPSQGQDKDPGVTLQAFRRLVRQEFGADLRHMTPANAREFLDRVQPHVEDIRRGKNGRIYLDEPQGTYEAIQRDFLRQALEAPNDQAIISMWLFCLELVTSGVSDVEAERFEKLFASVTADVD